MPAAPSTSIAAYHPIQDTAGLGPAMSAITPQQRAFVRALIDSGGADNTKAARLAGYSPDNPVATRTTAYRLAHDPKVTAAIREEAERTISASVALGARVLVEIAKDPMHKDRFKAANALLDRGGMLLVQKSEVSHIHTQDDKSVIDRIRVLADVLGIDAEVLLGQGSPGRAHEVEVVQPRLGGPVTDAEFTEVPPEIDWLEETV